jgi:hypothetical protein
MELLPQVQSPLLNSAKSAVWQNDKLHKPTFIPLHK